MNILQVTLGFYPAQAWGGPVKIVHQNSKELVARGHSVSVYCTNLLDKNNKIRPATFEQVIDGIRVVYLDTLNIKNWPGTVGPFWLPDLPSYLRREIHQFDLVHLNGYRSPFLLAVARAARKAGIPVVTQPHGTLPVIMHSFFLKKLYDRLLGDQEIKHIGCLIALQESEKQQALAHGIPAHKIEKIPNGIDPQEREKVSEKGAFRERFGIDPEKPLILFLGRINKKKGTDMLLEAFSRMNLPDARLVIAGPDDGQLAEVERLIQQLGLSEKVFLTGLLCGSDVLSAYQDADLFVLPCRTDTFPVTIMEACLMKLPMVITDRCEIADLVKGRVAEVVPFDPQAFAYGMALLLSEKERYTRYQNNCLAMINDTFSIQAVVDHLESVYRRVMKNQREK